MNFYKHHLGDYDGATMHLSWDEDMAYTRLMRVYYRDERPIPLEARAVYRLVRAQSKAQRAAVDDVLKEFFEQQVDGWHNKRCDGEIAAAQAQADTNRRIASNRLRVVNGSSNEPSHASSTNRPPIQTPDSKTPDSNSHKPDTHTPNLNSQSGARIAKPNGTEPKGRVCVDFEKAGETRPAWMALAEDEPHAGK